MDFVTLASLSSSRDSPFLRQLSSQDGMSTAATKPLLSPSADAELYVLATNFLLYVAMVIITIMVCRIYFPFLLERGEHVAEEEPVSRDANLLELEEDEEDDAAATSATGETEPLTTPLGLSVFDFDQRANDKMSVMKRLIFCCVMLNVTFVTWGVLQERMLTRRYPRFTGEYFTYSYALVFSNRVWTSIMSGFLLLYLKPRRSRGTVIYEYSFPSISNMLSSWCQYEALRYVSFPAATLFKCFKIAPVMAMGRIILNKKYPTYDFVVALIIGIGISLFMESTDNLEFGYNIHGTLAQTWTGILLLSLYLFFDSFTGQWQARMFTRHPDLSMIELLFAMSTFSSVLSFITLVHSNELVPAIEFVIRHSEIHLHFFIFSVCSTLGQLLIFYTIKNFGAVVFAIIMNFRILISIAVSCVMYGHPMSYEGYAGLLLVFAGVCYRIKKKSEGQRLITWKGMDDDIAAELVQEWHEHIEM